ncbi:hypothetical protein DFH09DRAFT_856509, partial [Mycena vulgaris]
CGECFGLISNTQFKKAVNKPCPLDDMCKNQSYRGHALAVLYGKAVGLREIIVAKVFFFSFTKFYRVLSGKYKGNDMFGGLLNAMIVKSDKEDRGVGSQGMRYTPETLEFWHI